MPLHKTAMTARYDKGRISPWNNFPRYTTGKPFVCTCFVYNDVCTSCTETRILLLLGYSLSLHHRQVKMRHQPVTKAHLISSTNNLSIREIVRNSHNIALLRMTAKFISLDQMDVSSPF
ncbi:hypothetical protein HOLleu_23053 [Holothuria leucospilota]|uniref:Uncharacterized protein n=1 Tax=Holothuria leucospilota TaxID=206669 RepID=A0A9Q1H4E7_HOLLE|nr:hypothetical protein HOLleu_23053 [Holothuria leucospilota]